MIFVRQNITHANREKIEGYLTHKWGLADQLPTDHPYAGIDFTIDENGSLRPPGNLITKRTTTTTPSVSGLPMTTTPLPTTTLLLL